MNAQLNRSYYMTPAILQSCGPSFSGGVWLKAYYMFLQI